MEEIWKDIKDYEGLYQVSNFGRVKSLDRTIYQDKDGTSYSRTIKGKFLKYNYDKQGYLLVHLCIDGIRKCFKVHRLVAETFIENTEQKQYVNHIDGNKENNNINNLEWVTPSENNIHAFKTGLHKVTKPMLGRTGKNNPCSKIIYQIDKRTQKILNQYYGSCEAERHTGIWAGNIISSCNGKVKTVGGYIWRYKE